MISDISTINRVKSEAQPIKKPSHTVGRLILYNENPAIVAGFHIGFADEKKTDKKSEQNVLCQRLPCAKGAVSEAD